MEQTKKQKFLRTFFLIGIVIAVAILVYPSFADSLNSAMQVARIGGYEDSIDSLNAAEIKTIKDAAIAYNEKIYAQQKQHEFIYEGEEYDDKEYDSILAPMKGSLLMGYVEIPKINIYLPITHGTHTEDLNFMVGHMRGTSVPIGGTSTHAVIAAHTGLQNANLFTDVDKLKRGDVFYIHVLNEIHVYTVDQIKVVLPGDEVPFLQIVGGKDYVTLFTCTPYGVNDHRLLVRGERTYPDLVYNNQESGMSDAGAHKFWAWVKTILLGLIPFVILGVGLYLLNRKKKSETDSDTNAITDDIDIEQYINSNNDAVSDDVSQSDDVTSETDSLDENVSTDEDVKNKEATP